MKKIPAQFYIFATALLLYCWPWQLSFFDPEYDALLLVVTLQLGFVMLCNYLVTDRWKYAVILIEVFCMLFNVTYFLMPSIPAIFHEQIMVCALIIELLIISLSLKGETIGKSDNSRLSMASFGMGGLRDMSLAVYRRKRALS